RVARGFGGDACVLSGGARRFGGGSQVFLLLPYRFECVAMLVADLARFLRQPPELLGLAPGRLRCGAVLFSDAVLVDRKKFVCHGDSPYQRAWRKACAQCDSPVTNPPAVSKSEQNGCWPCATIPPDLFMKSKSLRPFNVQGFLDSAGIAKTIVEYPRGEVIFTQGDPCEHVLYIQKGTVKLSVLSKAGREAVVAMLSPGEFFGEGCLAGQPFRMGTATALTPSTILLVDKERMVRLLRRQYAMSDRFIAHMLSRNIRIEEDLIDQLFNSSEKRLARALLLLTCYGKEDQTHGVLPYVSQGNLAEMIGTTRSRVNFFMNKFKKLGFIKYNGGLHINTSLLSIVLHD